MKLNINNLKNVDFWKKADIDIPKYDIKKIRSNKNPVWIHFGAGNIFRGFIAKIADDLLNDKLMTSGVIAVDTHGMGKINNYEMIDKVYTPFDNLSLLSLIESDGYIRNRVIGSISDVLHADFDEYYDALKRIFISSSLQVVSFTITEKGYFIKDINGKYNDLILKDMSREPKKSKNIMSLSTALLFERYKNSSYPVAMVSIDNCSNNGDKLKKSALEIAKEWNKNGFVDEGFIEYLEDGKKVSFPFTMVDKITPRPSKEIACKLSELGLKEIDVFQLGAVPAAPFVNSEVPEYLVIEDSFPNGRPPLEKANVYMTDRETVQKSERMKVSACLNPLHTSLAVFGCLLGYNYIYEEMKNPVLKKLIEKLGYDEAMKVTPDPKIINPNNFIKEVIEERFTNRFILDSPIRIATDTSQKIPIRYGETFKAYTDRNLDISSLIAIPITIAGWLRYLIGIDDNGNKMDISPDPMLEELLIHISKVKFKNTKSVGDNLYPILSDKNIFVVDLYSDSVNLGRKIENYFVEMIEDCGAVYTTLRKYIL